MPRSHVPSSDSSPLKACRESGSRTRVLATAIASDTHCVKYKILKHRDEGRGQCHSLSLF